MNLAVAAVSLARPAVLRLASLATLEAAGTTAIQEAAGRAVMLEPHQTLLVEGRRVVKTWLLLDGWAARVRELADGRRAILNFLLPGDLVGLCDQDRPVASSTVVAMTRMAVCQAPPRGTSRGLDRAYAMSRALEEAHLLNQIARLSRLNAHERLIDLLLELLERLEPAGLVSDDGYEIPVTQEVVGDVLGLSTVHVNRVIQQARRSGELAWSGGKIHIQDLGELRRMVGRQIVRVSARPSTD